jgi:DNA-directed RNA polymerase specialized sigma subunit
VRAAPRSSRGSSSGRLPRRSADDIAQVLDSVTSLVKKHKEGLRAEQIREELGLQAKELPRVLKEGLSSRKLKSKGQKRATTYFAS